MSTIPLGQYIRSLRVKKQLPLRALASELNIDQSMLSKIERNERQVTKNMIPVLAKVFDLDYKELQVKYLSEKIASEVQGEMFGLEALQAVEQTMKKLRTKRLKS